MRKIGRPFTVKVNQNVQVPELDAINNDIPEKPEETCSERSTLVTMSQSQFDLSSLLTKVSKSPCFCCQPSIH